MSFTEFIHCENREISLTEPVVTLAVTALLIAILLLSLFGMRELSNQSAYQNPNQYNAASMNVSPTPRTE